MQQKRELFQRALQADLQDGGMLRKREINEERLVKRDQWKRDLTGRANGTIDPYYQCDLFQEMVDYALNYSLPWSTFVLRIDFDIRADKALGGNSANGFDVSTSPRCSKGNKTNNFCRRTSFPTRLTLRSHLVPVNS